MAHKHGTDPENMASECFTACRSTGGGFCNRRHASYCGGVISSFGSENVKSIGWLSEPAEGQPKLRKLQPIRTAILLHARRGSHQSARLVQALGEKVDDLYRSFVGTGRTGMRILTPLALGTALLAAFSGSALAAGDAAKGAEVFKSTCGLCHQIGPGAKTLVGPELNGVVGRKAASTNYPMYSDIMKTLGDFGVVWTEGNIDRWIANPKAVLPGTYMTMFPGVPDASDRADIIAYLKTFPPQ